MEDCVAKSSSLVRARDWFPPGHRSWWVTVILAFHQSVTKLILFWFSTNSQFSNIDHKNRWATTWQNQQNGCVPSEDSDQPGHPPSLIRVYAVRMKKAWVLSYPLSTQRRFRSDWADAQADLSLHWAHTHFVGFVMSRFRLLAFWLLKMVSYQGWPNPHSDQGQYIKEYHLKRDLDI